MCDICGQEVRGRDRCSACYQWWRRVVEMTPEHLDSYVKKLERSAARAAWVWVAPGLRNRLRNRRGHRRMAA